MDVCVVCVVQNGQKAQPRQSGQICSTDEVQRTKKNPQWGRWGFFLKLPTEPCTLGSTQPLNLSTRMYRNSRGQRWPVRRSDDLTTFIVPKVEKIRSLDLPDLQGPFRACSRAKPLPYLINNNNNNNCASTIWQPWTQQSRRASQ
jgi:hypothetical protein